MRLSRLVALLAIALAGHAHAVDCAALLHKHLASDLALPFDAFDQDDHQGWRPLGDAGCEAEAATLIEAWADKQARAPQVLAWHRAQMLAKAGKTADAIAVARQTLRSGDDDSGFDWNDYANATIAFLQGDKPALQASRDRLAVAVAKSEFNQPNLRSADRLLRCFGQPYKIAYECPAAP